MPHVRKQYEQDQRAVLDLLQAFEEAKEIGLPEALRIFSELRRRLERQILHEEETLFPHFDKENGLSNEGPTAVMRVEHRQIRLLLSEIEEKLLRDDLKTDAEQVVLLEILRPHQQLERAMVYPSAEKREHKGRSSDC